MEKKENKRKLKKHDDSTQYLESNQSKRIGGQYMKSKLLAVILIYIL